MAIRSKKLVTLLTATSLLVGCSQTTTEVTFQKFWADYSNTPLDHLIFRGSDSTFHYFDHARFKTSDRIKIRRDQLLLPESLRPGEVYFARE